MHLADNRERVALEIVGVYMQNLFKATSLAAAPLLLSGDDTKILSQELEKIIGSDRDPLLQHLSLAATIYSHIYRKLKLEYHLGPKLGTVSPFGHLSLEELYSELYEGYYPRNRIVRLYFCEKMGASKIAETLGININTVKYHLRCLNKKYPKSKPQSIRVQCGESSSPF